MIKDLLVSISTNLNKTEKYHKLKLIKTQTQVENNI